MDGTKLNRVIVAWVAPIVMGVSLTLGSWAADVTPADADAKTKALEDRVKQLEKRVIELETNAANTARIEKLPRGRNFEIPQNDINKMFDEMRRQMMEQGNAFEFSFPNIQPNVPPNFAPNFPNFQTGPNSGMLNRARKLALGVAVGEITDELKTRFKNDVKDGVFVTQVQPNSPASKAGILVGDAITEIDGKAVANPKAFVDMIKAAGKGSHDVMLARRGELLKIKVDLAAPDAAFNGDPFNRGNGGGKHVQTELKVSSLELNDELARDLKLNDDQRNKMSQILAKHAKALSDEFSKAHATDGPGGMFGLTIDGNLNEMSKKHADDAAKELAVVLNEEQLKKWNDYRNSHSNISFSQSIQMENTGKLDLPKNDDDTPLRF